MSIEGTKISSFVKNTDKIWEGILIDSKNGLVVLNEQTNRWKKISDLDNIKILREEEDDKVIKDITSFDELVDKSFDGMEEVDASKVTEPNLEKVIKSLGDIGTSMGLEPEDDEKVKKQITDKLAMKNAESEQGETSGDEGQIENAKEDLEAFKSEIASGGLTESLSKLHPILQPYLKERLFTKDEVMAASQRELDKYHAKNIDEYVKKLHEHDGTAYEPDCEDEDNPIDYENDDYLDIPDDVKKDVMEKARELLDDNVDDIAEELAKSFELSDEDAEEYAVLAMEKYLSDTDIEPRECLEDEVEKDFEDTIDKFEGPNDELLDHLVDEYEIDPGEAEIIYEKNDGKLEETIIAFVDIVKNRLHEG